MKNKKWHKKIHLYILTLFFFIFIYSNYCYAYNTTETQEDIDPECNTKTEIKYTTDIRDDVESIIDVDVATPDAANEQQDPIPYEDYRDYNVSCLEGATDNCECPGQFVGIDENGNKYCTPFISDSTGSSTTVSPIGSFDDVDWNDEIEQECMDDYVKDYQSRNKTVVFLCNDRPVSREAYDTCISIKEIKYEVPPVGTFPLDWPIINNCIAIRKQMDIKNKVLDVGNAWGHETLSFTPQNAYETRCTVKNTIKVNGVTITSTFLFDTSIPTDIEEHSAPRIFTRGEGAKKLLYFWDGYWGHDPELYVYNLELRAASDSRFSDSPALMKIKNYDAYYKFAYALQGTDNYYFYLLNIDNPSSKYYNASGKYRLLTKNKSGATGTSCAGTGDPECKVIKLTSAQNDAEGINYLKRVHFRDELYRIFVNCSFYYRAYLTSPSITKYAVDYSLNSGSTGATTRTISFGTAERNVGNPRLLAVVDRDIYLTQSFVSLVKDGDVSSTTTHKDELAKDSAQKNIYDNLEIWNTIEELKEIATINVYGGYNDSGDVNIGEIEINKENGNFIYRQKRQPKEISQAYILYPTIKHFEKTYTICIGKYNCECEDIDVLCSCEDEEAGCSPELACPESNPDCAGPVADNEGAEPTDPKVYNSHGMSIISGGPGGITGKGSLDYMEKHLIIGSTIVQ